MEPAKALPLGDDHLRCTVVIFENAPKSLPRHDMNGVICGCRQRFDEFVVETLVVPLCVIVHYVFGYRCPQVSLTEGYDAVETLSAYGEHESFRKCADLDSWREGGGASRLHLSGAHVPPL